MDSGERYPALRSIPEMKEFAELKGGVVTLKMVLSAARTMRGSPLYATLPLPKGSWANGTPGFAATIGARSRASDATTSVTETEVIRFDWAICQ